MRPASMSHPPAFLDSMFDALDRDDPLKDEPMPGDSETEAARSRSSSRQEAPPEDPFLLGDFGAPSSPPPNPSSPSDATTPEGDGVSRTPEADVRPGRSLFHPEGMQADAPGVRASSDGAAGVSTGTPTVSPHEAKRPRQADDGYVVRSMYDAAGSTGAPGDTRELKLDPNAPQADAVEALNAAIADGWTIDDMAPRGSDAERHIVITLKRTRPPSLFDFG